MRLAARIVNRVLHEAGYQIVPLPRNGHCRLPTGAADHLRSDHPELLKLRAEYAAFDTRVTTGIQWKNRTIDADDLRHFRGHNAYVWQTETGASYGLTARYVESIDTERMLDRLAEDGLFGARTFEIDGRLVSRDLLDSIVEMYFLKRHGVRPASVLDIGAGYGRLAHRMSAARPCSYTCADAVPVSTFISGYYLRFRQSRAQVVALPDFGYRTADLAVNVHSFTECTVEAVEWWLSRITVKHLMVVPNAMDHGGAKIFNSKGVDLMPVIESNGYRLIAKEPKYLDPIVQAHGLQPTWHYLFAAH